MGKTIYARNCEDQTLEVNCAWVLVPDLRSYDILKHKGVVFEEASLSDVFEEADAGMP